MLYIQAKLTVLVTVLAIFNHAKPPVKDVLVLAERNISIYCDQLLLY